MTRSGVSTKRRCCKTGHYQEAQAAINCSSNAATCAIRVATVDQRRCTPGYCACDANPDQHGKQQVAGAPRDQGGCQRGQCFRRAAGQHSGCDEGDKNAAGTFSN
ncbi:MAG TPA: hypothetical protein VKV40_13120 [Ktedonobacteraceae bacterium]|nr:hypothetical protein [Ktedonobacteraceae bacterium]